MSQNIAPGGAASLRTPLLIAAGVVVVLAGMQGARGLFAVVAV